MRLLMIVRVGECLRCGQCCVDKEISTVKEWARMAPTDDPDVRIATVDNHYKTAVSRSCKSFEFDEDGLGVCKAREKRPQLCRDWPRDVNDLRLIDGCGYHFELRWMDGKSEQEGKAKEREEGT